MNRLSKEKQKMIIASLVEGNSIRATSRMTGAAKGTVLKLLADIGRVINMKPLETFLVRLLNVMKYGLSATQKKRTSLKRRKGKLALVMFIHGLQFVRIQSLCLAGMLAVAILNQQSSS